MPTIAAQIRYRVFVLQEACRAHLMMNEATLPPPLHRLAHSRGLPLWSGGVGFISILANRALSEVEPVVDASSSQSRADVLAIVMSAVLLLTGKRNTTCVLRIADLAKPLAPGAAPYLLLVHM